MAELKEITDTDRFIVLHEGKDKNGNLMNVLVAFAQSDLKNSNGRIYPKALLQREISRVQNEIDSGGFLGQADHPASGNTQLRNVSHIVNKMWMDDGGKCWSELKILDTTAGKNLKTIILAGGKLGVSTRGFGTMDRTSSMVNDDYKLANLDIVTNPSFQAGTFTKDAVFESANLDIEHKENTMNKLKKVEPKDCFYESRIAGIPAKEMAEKINKNNEKVEMPEHRKKLFQETLMACPEKSREEIDEIVNQTLVFESKIKPAKKEVLSEENSQEREKRKVFGNASLVRMAGGTAEDIKTLNAYDDKIVEKERKRRNLIAIIGRTGKIAGLGDKETEKLVAAELKLAGLE